MIPTIAELSLPPLERGRIHRFWVELTEDGLGRPLCVPVLIARGRRPGPIVGVTAAVHGNELNGIPTIHRLFEEVEPAELKGTIVGVPISNVPGYQRQQREFSDGSDLNREFPGKANGNRAEVYAYCFVQKVVRHFEYLIDLHTASFGRINSLYVRADMRHPVPARLARLISPQIIVHNEGADGTLRAAADDLGIHAITVEVGNPQRFQRSLIRSSRLGIQAVLDYLDMYDHDDDPIEEDTIECRKSYWIRTDSGGALHVFPDVADRVRAGDRIAVLRNVFGEVVKEYTCPEDGIVVGKSTDPVAVSGSRILHLGIEGHVETRNSAE